MIDSCPAFSLVPPPVENVQAPAVPRIDGVAPAKFAPTRCDAGEMTNLGLIDKSIGGTSEGITPNTTGNQPSVSMCTGNSLLNSAISSAGKGSTGGITINKGTTGGSSTCAAANAVGNLLSKAGSAGLSAAGGVGGLVSKVSCLLGLGTVPGGCTGLGAASDFGINSDGTMCPDAVQNAFGDLTTTPTSTACTIASGFDAFTCSAGDVTSAFNCFNTIGALSDISALSGVGCLAGAEGLAAADAFACIAAASAATDAAASIICSELRKQGRMRKSWHFASTLSFLKYSETLKRGYYVLAAPCVRHLRTKPKSLFSKFLEKTFNWQAEDAAAKLHFKGAKRRPIAKAIMAVILWPTCFLLGKTVARQEQVFTIGGSSAHTAS